MQPTKQLSHINEKLASYYSQLAWHAMLAEVNLTPKPGLVDRHNTGAHKDMALTDFHLSANAIAIHFPRFYRQVLNIKIVLSNNYYPSFALSA